MPPDAATATQTQTTTAPTTTTTDSQPWFSGFKNEGLKETVARFKTAEDMAESYQNLEKMKGVPENRLLRLPEKMEGPEARAIFERLGAPKEPKGYEIPRDPKAVDPAFADWAESVFHEAGITKSQGLALVGKYNERLTREMQDSIKQRETLNAQADENLKKTWGASYDQNINIVKQGAKILGLDDKTLNIMEALQGREVLFKNLQKIGVSLAESNFETGDGNQQPTTMTAEQAQAEMKALMSDQKFIKKFNRGDKESIERWTKLNQIAAPGQMEVGVFRR